MSGDSQTDFLNDPLNGWEETACGTCGATVVWARITKENGEPGKVPLDPKPPVYAIDRDGHVARRVAQGRERDRRVLVSHFATCKNPPKTKR